ncbi:hypothetical protein MKW98_013689 [Papaver atlanticum]|uniref:DUF3615 domain-containing protein n=1 Tax=Papaver atlanticum TaxID=357466 RepID=A0AAD4XCS9_9MAGN|nr:hypothetical protein MKW98_013689 [Papaver atlanticum]
MDVCEGFCLPAASVHLETVFAFLECQIFVHLELVEPGFLTTVYIGKCMLHHIDFTAKKTDVADAPEEMFFAELTSIMGVRCVELCKCMGPKDSISGDKNYGCRYCCTHNVQHPSDGGFKTGCVDE